MKEISKYDNRGNVVYSGVSRGGEVVRHFYKYDDQNRRIYYRKEESSRSYTEETEYLASGGYTIRRFWSDTRVIIFDTYNEYMRLLQRTVYEPNGTTTSSIYNQITGSYNIDRETHSGFIYIGVE